MIAISFNVAFIVFAIECGFFGPGRFCESRLLPARKKVHLIFFKKGDVENL
jgi:hypothetical protein